ncbi:MAG TPA: glycosyltransferase family 4 protein [Chloroflexota bacterium]|nr:glycosyltransferase family 4 protein [Chloroflexota bacterium]
MRLGYTITSYLPAIGGAQLHAHMLARELSSDFDVRVASMWSRHRTDWLRGTTLSGPLASRDYEIDGVQVTRLGLSRAERTGLLPSVLGYVLWQRMAVRRIGRTLLPHLRAVLDGAQLVHNFRIGREPLTYASAMLARELGIPFVLTPFHHPRWTSWLFRVYHELYRSADAVLALTEAERHVLIGLGVSAERISVVGHGPVLDEDPRADRFRSQEGIDGPIVLFLGQKFAYKGLNALLEAAPLVWRTHPSARFVFIGPRTPASNRLFRRVADPRIIEMDAVSLEVKTDALAACSLLCVPSAQESFGGVYVEAWSLGKPVIAADIPATRELIHHGEDGLVVSQDAPSLAEAIALLLDDSALATTLGQRGRDKVNERYRWPAVASRVAAVYQALLSRHGTVAEV